MAALRWLLLTAICAGLLTGVVTAGAHQFGTVPLILEAETYEEAAQHSASDGHARNPEVLVAATDEDWMPEPGIERSVYTLAADVLAAIGFAMLLAAGFALRGGEASWRQGLLWGLAGFATFSLAPGLGLPPELPGSAAAPLFERQLWWLMTALFTGAALALLIFVRRLPYALLAAALLVLPHVVGAPRSTGVAAAPPALEHRFAVVATLVSLLFWLVLGLATGHFYRRFLPRIAGPASIRNE